MRYLLIASVLIFAGAGFALVEEPEGYRGEPYNAEVPATLEGAKVVGDEEAYALWEEGAGFIDVYPHAPKPANLPEGTVWHERPHLSIEGAIWLPNVGYEALAEETMEYFKAGLKEATEGDKDAPVVIYCLENCWMSWNASKRAMELGYSDVIWYPEGVDGWDFMDYPTEKLLPWEVE